MNSEFARLSALSIAGAGLMIGIAGLLAWYWRDALVPQMRYVLPIPPLGVAAYVFVFNLVRERPEIGVPALAREIALGTGIAAITFASFAAGILLFLRAWK